VNLRADPRFWSLPFVDGSPALSTTIDPFTGETIAAAAPRRAGPGARVLAMIAALLILLVAGLLSAGIVLCAAIVMGIVAYVFRRRRAALSRGASWLAAVAGAALGFVLAFGAMTAHTPVSWREIMNAADSAAMADTTRPPAWLERMSPATTRAAREQRKSARPTATIWSRIGVVWVFGFVIVLFASVFGSIGWAGGMLLGFAVKGRWPGTHALAAP
jgi:hypothetical protein